MLASWCVSVYKKILQVKHFVKVFGAFDYILMATQPPLTDLVLLKLLLKLKVIYIYFLIGMLT